MFTILTISFRYTSYSRVRVYNADYWNIDIPKMFAVEQVQGRLSEDVSFKLGNTGVVADMNGLLKSISTDGKPVPVHMDYVQ